MRGLMREMAATLFEVRCRLELEILDTPWTEESDIRLDDLRGQLANVVEVMHGLRLLDMDVINSVIGAVEEGASGATLVPQEMMLYVYGNHQEATEPNPDTGILRTRLYK